MKLRRSATLDALLANVSNQDSNEIGEHWIEHKVAIRLGKIHNIKLFDLLKGTEVFHEPRPSTPPKTKEYIELMAKLRRDESENEYKKMAGLALPDEQVSFKEASKEINRQLTTIFNVLISVVSVSWAFWYWFSNWSLGVRTLAALFGGILIAVAEAVVLNGYYRRLNESKKIKAKKEKQREKMLSAEDRNHSLDIIATGSSSAQHKNTSTMKKRTI